MIYCNESCSLIWVSQGRRHVRGKTYPALLLVFILLYEFTRRGRGYYGLVIICRQCFIYPMYFSLYKCQILSIYFIADIEKVMICPPPPPPPPNCTLSDIEALFNMFPCAAYNSFNEVFRPTILGFALMD